MIKDFLKRLLNSRQKDPLKNCWDKNPSLPVLGRHYRLTSDSASEPTTNLKLLKQLSIIPKSIEEYSLNSNFISHRKFIPGCYYQIWYYRDKLFPDGWVPLTNKVLAKDMQKIRNDPYTSHPYITIIEFRPTGNFL